MTFMDVLGHVGGLLQIANTAVIFLMIPFKYNLTKVSMLQAYLPDEF